jgi:GMP synthase (glutamine-hydrolysing)
MLSNFLDLCRVKREWSMERFMEAKTASIRKMLGDRKVFLLVSGGVDSTVAYAMLSKALGTNHVYGLFVDTGFLRKNEGKKIAAALKKIGVKNFHLFPAKKRFFEALNGVMHPEEKRKIIGDLFLEVQAQAVRKLKLDPEHWVLGQGTIYPDTIESAGTKYADKIKTHHNRVPEILELIKKGRVIEPLAELYKDEVRNLGAQLGLPDTMVWKHPFPGPGLAVRILCADIEKFSEGTPSTEEAIEAFLMPYRLSGKILPIQSVGVQGDARTYRNPLAVWGKNTAFDELENLSTALTNRYAAINRVCLLLAPEKIHSVKILPGTLSEKRVRLLQELDDIVMTFIKKNHMERDTWQFPTILLPLSVNGVKREAVMLRPVCSEEAMTANFYKMDKKLLARLTAKLAPKVSAVFYDITNKPPATIEWE